MNGYHGEILRVNLSNRRITTEKPPEDFYQKYLGGRGFIAYWLLTELGQGIDPLGPENKLIFALGALTGHPLLGSGRNSIGSKSPLTGVFAESEVGGFWGAELRKTGFDAIIIEGVSDQPVFLSINNRNVHIHEAGSMWGMEIAETVAELKNRLESSKIRTATIGPAGEKLVRYACIMNDISHAAGRTGLGAVMGSKRLKAIAVQGEKNPEMADKDKITELSRWMGKNYKEKTPFWKCGTGSAMISYENKGNLPIRNFQGGRFPAIEKITPQKMMEKDYLVKMDGCFMCPVRCKRKVKCDKPWSVDPVYGSPEYETLAAFGSNCGIDDVEAIMKGNEICNRYGIDTISAGVAISFAMECFENGIIGHSDTDGLDLVFGNSLAMVQMVENIAMRKGFGHLLGEGVRIASEKIGKGSDRFAMHVKGEELPMHEPRYKQGLGLHYSIHASGPDHCCGIHDDTDAERMSAWESIDIPVKLPSTELSPAKVRMLYHLGAWRHLNNYLGLCQLVPWSFGQIKDAVEAVTGWPMSYWRLMKTVERGLCLARIFNIMEGLTINDDRLPERFYGSPHDGPLKEVSISKTELAESQLLYYQMMGWDNNGIPTRGRLVELDIEWACDYLPKLK